VLTPLSLAAVQVTLVDTVGAWPTFECEVSGQSEAIATNLTVMAGLRVPIITGTRALQQNAIVNNIADSSLFHASNSAGG
jgi:hypothetical protein